VLNTNATAAEIETWSNYVWWNRWNINLDRIDEDRYHEDERINIQRLVRKFIGRITHWKGDLEGGMQAKSSLKGEENKSEKISKFKIFSLSISKCYLWQFLHIIGLNIFSMKFKIYCYTMDLFILIGRKTGYDNMTWIEVARMGSNSWILFHMWSSPLLKPHKIYYFL
jgi:hypothetical protein